MKVYEKRPSCSLAQPPQPGIDNVAILHAGQM